MLDIDTSGVAAFAKLLRAEAAAIRTEVRRVFREWAVHIHADIATLSPQWSGNLAANWAIDLNAATSTAQELGDPLVRTHYAPASPAYGRAPYSRGMLPAVEIALQRGASFQMPKLTDTIVIHNPVEYADEVEADSGPRRIRAVNRLPRDEGGKIAMVFHAYEKYRTLPLSGLGFTRE